MNTLVACPKYEAINRVGLSRVVSIQSIFLGLISLMHLAATDVLPKETQLTTPTFCLWASAIIT